jgi:hypothetical protein
MPPLCYVSKGTVAKDLVKWDNSEYLKHQMPSPSSKRRATRAS